MDLKIIGKEIGCEIPLTTYVWRHSFATVLKNEKQASIEEISELLNHSDIKVTEVYLKKFPQKHLDKLADSL